MALHQGHTLNYLYATTIVSLCMALRLKTYVFPVCFQVGRPPSPSALHTYFMRLKEQVGGLQSSAWYLTSGALFGCRLGPYMKKNDRVCVCRETTIHLAHFSGLHALDGCFSHKAFSAL